MSESGYEDDLSDNQKETFYYDDGRDRTLSSKLAARRQLEEDMNRFLTGGGAIQSIEPNVRADPPRKPESNYGSRPI